jgi:hypothetical protein
VLVFAIEKIVKIRRVKISLFNTVYDWDPDHHLFWGDYKIKMSPTWTLSLKWHINSSQTPRPISIF